LQNVLGNGELHQRIYPGIPRRDNFFSGPFLANADNWQILSGGIAIVSHETGDIHAQRDRQIFLRDNHIDGRILLKPMNRGSPILRVEKMAELNIGQQAPQGASDATVRDRQEARGL